MTVPKGSGFRNVSYLYPIERTSNSSTLGAAKRNEIAAITGDPA